MVCTSVNSSKSEFKVKQISKCVITILYKSLCVIKFENFTKNITQV